MDNSKIKRIIADVAIVCGIVLMMAGLLMFLILNDGVFFSTVGMGFIYFGILAIIPVGYSLIYTLYKGEDKKLHTALAIASIAIAVLTLVLCIYFGTISNLVQPLVLNTNTMIVLIAACVVLLIAAFLQLLFHHSLVSIVTASTVTLILLTGVIWVHSESYKGFNETAINSGSAIFKNGEKGYDTFRIPSLIALNHEDINKAKGYKLKEDILLATAEGRESSHDTGQVDLVGKISKDGGKTWGDLKTIYSYTDEVGKFGNPTPVLDKETGNLIFPYMTATKANKFNYDTFVAIANITKDGDIEFPSHSENQNISLQKGAEEDGGSDGVRSYTLMVGPGKSIQLKSGRLVIPASSNKKAFVMYSDDHGKTWNKGERAGQGNECEAVELDNGELCMVVRDNEACTGDHFKQYQRLSYSRDGGETWYIQTDDTSLRASICMSSIAKLPNGTLLLSYPDSFFTRVNLSISASQDNGKTFTTTPLYAGPAGYSCITVDSKGNLYMLAEIGKVNYNEQLLFIKINADRLI